MYLTVPTGAPRRADGNTSDMSAQTAAAGSELWRTNIRRLTRVAVIANGVGGLLVFLLLSFLIPFAPEGAQEDIPLNAAVGAVYLAVTLVLGSRFGMRASAPVQRWLESGRPPTAEERRIAEEEALLRKSRETAERSERDAADARKADEEKRRKHELEAKLKAEQEAKKRFGEDAAATARPGAVASKAWSSFSLSWRVFFGVMGLPHLLRDVGRSESGASGAAQDRRLTGSPELPRASRSASPSFWIPAWMSLCWPG